MSHVVVPGRRVISADLPQVSRAVTAFEVAASSVELPANVAVSLAALAAIGALAEIETLALY